MNKGKLKQKVEAVLSKYSLISKYYKEVIENQFSGTKSVVELLEIPLIRYAVIDSPTLNNLESYINDHSFTNIDIPLTRLKTNFENEYHSILAELHTAKLLKEEGMDDIKFLSPNANPDIEFKENGNIRYAEVKSLIDLSPEFSVLHNKLHAQSILDSLFERDFIIQCEYNFYEFDNINKFHSSLKSSVDNLIQQIRPLLITDQIKDATIIIDNFKFKVTSKKGRVGFLFMYSGGGTIYSSAKDCFLDLSSVYSRFINKASEGFKQLLKKRNMDQNLVKDDRIYFFLNTGSYSRVIPNEVKEIFTGIGKIIGLTDLVQIKIEV